MRKVLLKPLVEPLVGIILAHYCPFQSVLLQYLKILQTDISLPPDYRRPSQHVPL